VGRRIAEVFLLLKGEGEPTKSAETPESRKERFCDNLDKIKDDTFTMVVLSG